jgi:hypothetical protein
MKEYLLPWGSPEFTFTSGHTNLKSKQRDKNKVY